MRISKQLTLEEKLVAKKIDKYFQTSDMDFKEKIFNAILIAQHELDAHYFSDEYEKQKILHFKNVLESLLEKIGNDNLSK